MQGPGPLDDWSGWNEPTRQLRPSRPPQPVPGAPEAWGQARPGIASAPADQPASWDTPTQVYSPRQQANPGYAPLPSAPPRPAAPGRRRRRTWVRVARYALLALVLLMLVSGALVARRLYAFGQAISSQAPLSTQTGFMTGSNRINVVVLGYGGTGHDGAYLTDSMLIVSFVPSTGATTLLSVPRDLWVQVPPNSGQYAKINTAYQTGLYNGYNGMPAGKLAAGAEAASKVSEVTGLTVNYWVSVDFTGFRKLVDALGGVEVNVPVAFTALYPRNDDPSIDAGWKTIHFNTGLQHMNGEQAIEYARARYVQSPPSEGTDFARSVRQQILVRAILSRARQVSAWPGLSAATDAMQSTISTNLSLADLLMLADKMNFKNPNRVGLSTDNVLVNAVSSDGQDILLPANGDWNAIQQYVAQQLAK